MSSEPVLSLNDVEMYYQENKRLLDRFRPETQPVKAVDGVSLDIAERDVVVLIGESGCGKTTLGKTMVGLEQPTAGEVRYRGQDIWEAKSAGWSDTTFEDIRRSLQIIHQDPSSSLNQKRTVLSCLSDPLKRWHSEMDAASREYQIHRLLERVGLKPARDYASRFPHQLSGGETQRVVLLRALMMEPDVIVADEAVSALDVSLRVEMMDLLLSLQGMFDTSFVYVTHDFSTARYLAVKAGGRIGVMYLGKLVEVGPATEILESPTHPYTKALSWAAPSLDPAPTDSREERPIRDIDTPDPRDHPSGCKFHPRCPEARETCAREEPDLFPTDSSVEVSCYRADNSHDYWESESLVSD